MRQVDNADQYDLFEYTIDVWNYGSKSGNKAGGRVSFGMQDSEDHIRCSGCIVLQSPIGDHLIISDS